MVSWGYGCALAGLPGVYAELSQYIDWIKETIGVAQPATTTTPGLTTTGPVGPTYPSTCSVNFDGMCPQDDPEQVYFITNCIPSMWLTNLNLKNNIHLSINQIII